MGSRRSSVERGRLVTALQAVGLSVCVAMLAWASFELVKLRSEIRARRLRWIYESFAMMFVYETLTHPLSIEAGTRLKRLKEKVQKLRQKTTEAAPATEVEGSS